jgi:hypothetical protein
MPSTPSATRERREALRRLIGICKTDQPPNDEEVERILEPTRIEEVRLMRVLLDINVILDAVLQRAPWHNSNALASQCPHR